MKKLLIVESPGKIKTIKKFLDADFKVMSTMGHIKDLPSKTMGVTRDPIAIEYVPLEDKDKTIAELCKAARDADEVYLAPDPDREGEIIAWHAAEEIKKVMKKKGILHRITFNEITKKAILNAIANPHHINMQKVAAQQARRVLDRWVGYEVSPILWKKITKGLSAGRVQSVALKLICDRELAIRAFKPEEYWSIIANLKAAAGSFSAALTHINKKKVEVTNEKQATGIVEGLKKEAFAIESITDKKRVKNPMPPFMTSSLQQAAFNRLGFSVDKTMSVAQNLYEGVALDTDTPTALITYMRTDSLRVSDDAITQARGFIKDSFGKEYLPSAGQQYEEKTKGPATQDAHEAVRPIDVSLTPDMVGRYLSKDQAKLYELIWKRFVASQMTPAEYAQRQVVVQGGIYTLKTTGSTLLFDGFLKVYQEDIEDDESKPGAAEEADAGETGGKLPQGLAEKDNTKVTKIDPKQHFTQAPPRYNEASLVKELKKEGIGRPSTYSAILKTIRARAYTTLDKKRFVPTELGMTVSAMLGENLPHIMNTQFTALMEEDLDKIADGSMERDALLNTFWEQFEKDLIQFKGDAGKTAQLTDITCPECNKSKLAIRFGKSGEFMGCTGYPECSFTSNFARDQETGILTLVEKEAPQTVDLHCPQCGKQLCERIGKFGKFISCPGYPECKYIHQNKASFKCPNDGGDVVERKWRGGTFWGCSNYPKCKFALFGDIIETPCPQCKLPALITKTDPKTGVENIFCSDKKCGYKK